MSLALNFTKSFCLVLLRSAEESLMLWLYGNGFIKKAVLNGFCRHTSQKQPMQLDLGMIEQCLYQIRAGQV